MRTAWFSVVLCLAALVIPAEGRKKLFCYYSSDAQYRSGPGRFVPENIDPQLCTHIIFAFFQPTKDGSRVRTVGWNDEDLYARTVALKKQNRDLRVLLAIGGWVIGSEPFLPIIKNYQTISRFAKNVVAYLRKYGMDGMDMDWEFPGVRGSTPEDKPMFTLLLKTLQEEFTRDHERTGREKLILTLATAAGSYYIGEGYQTDQVVLYPDYLLLMTYNYHGAWENVTGHHSCVWSSYRDTGFRKELNMQWTVDFWLSQGAPRHKLILGLATYGMTFTLKNPRQNGILAPAYGGGRGAQYTKEYGIMAYYEVCENLEKHGWRSEWIADQKAPFAYGGDQWVGYDNIKSLNIKVDTLINDPYYNLAGAFVWSVEMDDFRGLCGQGPYPLLNTIVNMMDGGGPYIPATTRRPPRLTTRRPRPLLTATPPRPNVVTTTPAYPSTGSANSCSSSKWPLFKHPKNCGQFIICLRGVDGKDHELTMNCPPGTAFSEEHLVCAWNETCNN